MGKADLLSEKAKLVRKWCLVSTSTAGSGHPTSCLSAADLMTVLFDRFFACNVKKPQNTNNDRLVFSKGHASPLLYTLFALSGAFALDELKTLRKFGSRMEGHPTPAFPWADIATGSLGQGLSIGAGLAYALRGEIRNLPKTYVLLGDGEMAEGSVWEAANFASYYTLDNLIAIVDVNGLGQSQQTMFGHKGEEYVKRFTAFGWDAIEIDGHNLELIQKAFIAATGTKTGKPFAIVANTKKGKGISFLEDKDGWHGKALSQDQLKEALAELGDVNEFLKFELRMPSQLMSRFASDNVGPVSLFPGPTSSVDKLPAGARRGSPALATHIKADHAIGEMIATREVYGTVLAELGRENQQIFALDGDVKNSTFSQDFLKAYPERFIECFIAEQNMVGVALGLSRQGKIPFVSTFAAFLTRAADQIRMTALSKGNVKFVGSHAGVSIGEDGASQMGLEDFALFGAIPDSIIFHPSDAVSSAKILPLMVSHTGISYLRTLRPKTPVLYDQKEEFTIGGSKVLRSSDKDVLTIVAAGITVHEALKAYEILKKKGISIRVVDCYSVKPIDKSTIEQCSNETTKKIIITVEDHYEHGGLGDFVLSAVSLLRVRVEKMAVSTFPRSGTKDELLEFAGISTQHIVEKVKQFIV